MTIEIREGRYFARMWFCADPTSNVDMMGALFRDGPDASWEMAHRIRLPDDSKDWFRSTWPPDAENVAGLAQAAIERFARTVGAELHTLFLNTDDPKEITARLAEQEWTHFRKMTDEELKGRP